MNLHKLRAKCAKNGAEMKRNLKSGGTPQNALCHSAQAAVSGKGGSASNEAESVDLKTQADVAFCS